MPGVPWIVLPTFDEAENLESIVAAILRVLRDSRGPGGFRVLVVDDSSPDGTGDIAGGFKCFRREVLEAIDLPTIRSRGYAFQVELTYRACRRGFRVAELPIVFRDRQLGQSKMSWRIAGEAMLLVPRLRGWG